MTKKVDKYWPRATVVEADGSVMELKVEDGLRWIYYAYKQLKQWREEYGERVTNEIIDVRGEKKRLKYTIYVTD